MELLIDAPAESHRDLVHMLHLLDEALGIFALGGSDPEPLFPREGHIIANGEDKGFWNVGEQRWKGLAFKEVGAG